MDELLIACQEFDKYIKKLDVVSVDTQGGMLRIPNYLEFAEKLEAIRAAIAWHEAASGRVPSKQ